MKVLKDFCDISEIAFSFTIFADKAGGECEGLDWAEAEPGGGGQATEGGGQQLGQ